MCHLLKVGLARPASLGRFGILIKFRQARYISLFFLLNLLTVPVGLPISLGNDSFFSLIIEENLGKNELINVSLNICVFRLFVERQLLRLFYAHVHTHIYARGVNRIICSRHCGTWFVYDLLRQQVTATPRMYHH